MKNHPIPFTDAVIHMTREILLVRNHWYAEQLNWKKKKNVFEEDGYPTIELPLETLGIEKVTLRFQLQLQPKTFWGKINAFLGRNIAIDSDSYEWVFCSEASKKNETIAVEVIIKPDADKGFEIDSINAV